MSLCESCGRGRMTMGILGMRICSQCGAADVLSGDMKGVSDTDVLSVPGAIAPGSYRVGPQLFPRCSPLPGAVTLPPQIRRLPTSATMRLRVKNREQCKSAVSSLLGRLALQDSIKEPTVRLAIRHCGRLRRSPTNGWHSYMGRCMLAACITIVGHHKGLGLTIQEVAHRAYVNRGRVQRIVWQIRKISGVRYSKDEINLDALLQRCCDAAGLKFPRGAVCSLAMKFMEIADSGWIGTGRHQSPVVAAIFVFAAKVYHVEVDIDSLATHLCIHPRTVRRRHWEFRRFLHAIMQDLPWADVITPENIHVYAFFVHEFGETLMAANKLLQDQRMAGAGSSGQMELGDAGSAEDVSELLAPLMAESG